MSLTLLEAMAMGVICVSTKDTGAQDVINHGENGFLYTTGNVTELSDMIEFIYQSSINYRMNVANKSSLTIRDCYSVGKIVNTWKATYKSILTEFKS